MPTAEQRTGEVLFALLHAADAGSTLGELEKRCPQWVIEGRGRWPIVGALISLRIRGLTYKHEGRWYAREHLPPDWHAPLPQLSPRMEAVLHLLKAGSQGATPESLLNQSRADHPSFTTDLLRGVLNNLVGKALVVRRSNRWYAKDHAPATFEGEFPKGVVVTIRERGEETRRVFHGYRVYLRIL